MAASAASEHIASASERGDPLIVFREAGKSFGSLTVLRDLSLTIGRGEMFGLIGPSGSGKTTLVKLAVGLSMPTEGLVTVFGVSPSHAHSSVRGRIGYAPQDFFLYPTLSTWANLLFAGSLYGMGWRHRRSRARELLRHLDLWEARKRRTSALSGGMRRRLLLASALMHEPRLLIVDEPTAGLDPELRLRIWELLQRLPYFGVTVLVTTQLLDEATHCHRVGMLDQGVLVAVGTPDELRRRSGLGDVVLLEVDRADDAELVELRTLEGVRGVERRSATTLRVIVDDGAHATPLLTEQLMRHGVHVETVSTRPPSFDEVFLTLLGR